MPDTAVTLSFGDGEYVFWLPLPQVIELERKCGKSIFAIYDALGAGLGLDGETPVYIGGGSAMLTEVREVIRLGLIGGNCGMVDGQEIEVGPMKAKQLVDEYVYPARPMIEGVHQAWAITHAAITGISVKKKADPVKAEAPKSSAKGKSSQTAE